MPVIILLFYFILFYFILFYFHFIFIIMPVIILNALHALTHLFPHQPCEVGTVIIFNLQMRKLKYVEAKETCPR